MCSHTAHLKQFLVSLVLPWGETPASSITCHVIWGKTVNLSEPVSPTEKWGSPHPWHEIALITYKYIKHALQRVGGALRGLPGGKALLVYFLR